jgi:hypothetical protein
MLLFLNRFFSRAAAISVLFSAGSAFAASFDCTALRPEPPKNTDVTYTGKLNGKFDGLFKKLASIGADLEGTYRDISSNVLKDFPDASKLYMWERLLYLQCQLMAQSTSLSDGDKQRTLNALFQQLNAPPASVTNTGDNNVIIQGSGNKVGK